MCYHVDRISLIQDSGWCPEIVVVIQKTVMFLLINPGSKIAPRIHSGHNIKPQTQSWDITIIDMPCGQRAYREVDA